MVDPIGTDDGATFDGWSAWSFTTCNDPNGCPKTTPTSFTGWLDAYDVISPDIVNVTVNGTSLSPVDTEPSPIFRNYFLSNSTTTRYKADSEFVYPAALIAQVRTQQSVFTLTTAGMVGFAIDDRAGLGDNRGGISLDVNLIQGGLTIDTSLSAIKLGESFSQQLAVLGGTAPFSWSIISGNPPVGMTLSEAGVLSGTPTALGSSTFTVQVTDNNGDNAEKAFTVDVVLVLPPPDIRLNKVGTVPVPGRVLDYFIVVENSGEVTVNNLSVIELLESWLTLQETNPVPFSIRKTVDLFPLTSDEAQFESLIEWNIAKLDPAETAILTYKVTLRPNFPLRSASYRFGMYTTNGSTWCATRIPPSL